jgi:hypothetical protein
MLGRGEKAQFICALEEDVTRLVEALWFLNQFTITPDDYYEPEDGDEVDEDSLEMKWTAWCREMGDPGESIFYKVNGRITAWMPLPPFPGN